MRTRNTASCPGAVYASAITLLVGVQVDELMRKGSHSRGSFLSGVRAVTGG